MKETIEKITLLDDNTIFIKTNKRTYQRTEKRSVNDDSKYFVFQKKEYFIKNLEYSYNVEKI